MWNHSGVDVSKYNVQLVGCVKQGVGWVRPGSGNYTHLPSGLHFGREQQGMLCIGFCISTGTLNFRLWVLADTHSPPSNRAIQASKQPRPTKAHQVLPGANACQSDLGTLDVKLESGSQVGHRHVIYGTKRMIQIMKPRQGGPQWGRLDGDIKLSWFLESKEKSKYRRGENNHCRQAVSLDRDGDVHSGNGWLDEMKDAHWNVNFC